MPTRRFRERSPVQVNTKISEPGESHQRQWIRAHGHRDAADLREAPGDDRAPGVEPEAQAVGDAGGDGDDVLQRTTHLHPDDVDRGVRPERLGLQRGLDPLGHLLVVRGDGHHRRHPGRHLLGERGADTGLKSLATAILRMPPSS